MSDPINTLFPPIDLEIHLDLQFFVGVDGKPDFAKIRACLEGTAKQIETSRMVAGEINVEGKRAAYWVIHTNDEEE